MNEALKLACQPEYPLQYQETNWDLADGDWCDFMEFRLVYEGTLKSSSDKKPRPIEQHIIRKQLHKQLAALWREHPALKNYRDHLKHLKGNEQACELWPIVNQDMTMETENPYTTYLEFLADSYKRCNYRFVPLVHETLGLVCELDILFLRRSNPGDLIGHGGDLDNRIKTLFDALKVPDTCNGLDANPAENEDPFYCLLQDDSLITAVNITTDKLLTPVKREHGQDDVFLILNIKIKTVAATFANLQLA